MAQAKPLMATEVPESLVPFFFFDRQFSSNRGTRIWRQCKNCFQEYHSLVADIRISIGRSQLMTGLCGPCAYKPGPHQKGTRRKNIDPDKGSINAAGYVTLYRLGHPSADKRGYIFEHRLVMEEIIGRLLHVGETIHHKNRKRADNRPENLELWVGDQPSGARVRDLYLSFVREAMLLEGCDDAVERVLFRLHEAPDSVL